MLPRRHLRAVAVAAAIAAAMAAFATPAARAADGICGGDANPPCPEGQTVSPPVVGSPTRATTITITGANLVSVAQALLQPGGQPLHIVSATASSLVLDLPNGLGAGIYHVDLAVRGQTQFLSSTPIFQVAAAGAGSGALPQFSFAPPPPVGRAAAAAAPAQPSALATLPGSASSLPAQILHGALVAIMLAGAGLVLVTLGYIYRTYSRAAQMRGLAFAALDRMLHDLWAEGEQHTAPAVVQARYSSQLAMVLAQADPAAPEVSAPRY